MTPKPIRTRADIKAETRRLDEIQAPFFDYAHRHGASWTRIAAALDMLGIPTRGDSPRWHHATLMTIQRRYEARQQEGR